MINSPLLFTSHVLTYVHMYVCMFTNDYSIYLSSFVVSCIPQSKSSTHYIYYTDLSDYYEYVIHILEHINFVDLWATQMCSTWHKELYQKLPSYQTLAHVQTSSVAPFLRDKECFPYKNDSIACVLMYPLRMSS